MEVKTKVCEWIKGHKKIVIATGVTVATVVGVALITKNWNVIKCSIQKDKDDLNFFNKVNDVVENVQDIGDANVINLLDEKVNVREHIRNLSGNMCASARKEALAAERGIELGIHQTLVDAYQRRKVA